MPIRKHLTEKIYLGINYATIFKFSFFFIKINNSSYLCYNTFLVFLKLNHERSVLTSFFISTVLKTQKKFLLSKWLIQLLHVMLHSVYLVVSGWLVVVDRVPHSAFTVQLRRFWFQYVPGAQVISTGLPSEHS